MKKFQIAVAGNGIILEAKDLRTIVGTARGVKLDMAGGKAAVTPLVVYGAYYETMAETGKFLIGAPKKKDR